MQICRFVSLDNIDVTTATPMALTYKNLFAYCDNNPVMRVDRDGEFWVSTIWDGVKSVGYSWLENQYDFDPFR